jgi:protein translocase SEC61 complex gamma subunit
MGLRSFLSSTRRLMKLAVKPRRDELWISIRICVLGVIVIGVLGYIIKIISSLIQGSVA